MEIEISNRKGKFTLAELRAKVRESNEFWNSPEGRSIAAKRSKKATTAAPSIAAAHHRLDLLSK